ncbi:ABC transporter ATP-binding protein [Corynebacterium sp. sy039]|uniref:ABC transporter ATP-binding protein n=1 Tax=Corynebacterium sp. sy039 TaxID=2599641 RepID=UPI0011B741BD|nr:ABC transporter ATP-binding protein [Corynebacterium sp. sy039]QDZ43180.1 ABC transporter ATP-binding protein [Corynebacterium sp. sy039]
MSNSPALLVEEISRTYQRGEIIALKNVSFSLAPGEILGLVGINGAGKTTTLKICATILAPSSGRVAITGIDAVAHPERARAHIGMMFGVERGFYARASLHSNLRFFADLADVPYRAQRAEIDRVLSLVGLSELRKRAVATLSHGQRQRAHIARALLGNPALVLLDEPTSGLDPDVSVQIRNVVRQVADSGTAIVLSSHSMAEIAQLSNNIVLLDQGEVLVSGSEQHIFDFAQLATVVQFSHIPHSETEVVALRTALASLGVCSLHAQGGTWCFSIYVPPPYNRAEIYHRIQQACASARVAMPHDVTIRDAVFEDAFLALAARRAQ